MQNNKIDIHAKSGYARLLAAENLTVIHSPKAKTGSFNSHTRKLILPMMEKMHGHIYNAFIAHEVGHALFTPKIPEKELKDLYKNVKHSYVNITEDARIEKLIKRKFPGVIKDMTQFYKEMAGPERNFFGINGKDIGSLSLIDRVNLYFKIGSFTVIPFTDAEKELVKLVAKAETWEEAVEAAKAIKEFTKEEKKKNKKNKKKKNNNKMTGESIDDGHTDTTEIEEEEVPDEEEEDEDEAETQEEFDKNLTDNLIDNDANERTASFGDIHRMDSDWKQFIFPLPINISVLNVIDKKDYENFIQRMTPTINMMVSYFNSKKSAADYQRTEVAKTGTLDTKQLANYKFTEDIFLKEEIVHNAQNHGMVMFIDWSDSMEKYLDNTIKQLLLLTEFCRKTKIPFEVYGFTNNSSKQRKPQGSEVYLPENHIMGEMHISVFKLLSSTMPYDEYYRVSAFMFECCKLEEHVTKHGTYFKSKCDIIFPTSATPINSLAFLSEYIINDFKKRNRVEKTHMILLTDGDYNDYKMYNGQEAIDYEKTITMRDSQSGINYDYPRNIPGWHSVFKYVKEKCNVTKMIGFFLSDKINPYVLSGIFPGDYINNHIGEIEDEFYANNIFGFGKNIAFDKFFVVSINNFKLKGVDSSKVGVNPYYSDKKKQENIHKYLMSQTESLLFMKKFIEDIA